jgi:integrase
VQRSTRPATYRSYNGLIEKHINPHIGGVSLAKLSPVHVQGLYLSMERDGCSGRLRQMVHAVLHNALGRALKWNLVMRNVCDAVESPKVTKRAMQVWIPQEASKFLAVAAEDRLYALYVLAIATALRQEELLGLYWTDIDLNEATLSVRR